MSLDRDMLQQVYDMPAPPCDGCPWAETCAGRHLACGRFEHYVEFEPPRVQDKRSKWDSIIYTDKGEVPTRQVYERIFKQSDRIHRFDLG